MITTGYAPHARATNDMTKGETMTKYPAGTYAPSAEMARGPADKAKYDEMYAASAILMRRTRQALLTGSKPFTKVKNTSHPPGNTEGSKCRFSDALP
jgi:hypothetical protein